MRWSGCPGIMSDMARKAIGALKTTPTQNRRVMSTSSGLASSSKVTVRGSSAIPQIGTGTRLRAHDFRMHGADVLGLYGWSGRGRGFQSHAALGASAGLGLADLGIHRTDVGSLLGFI